MSWRFVLAVWLLHLGVLYQQNTGKPRLAAHADLGLLVVKHHPEYRTLYGPFDLWAGDWWRVPMGGLHHAGFFHLGIVSAILIYLGRRMEPEIRASTYLLLVIGALLVTTLPRWQLDRSVPSWFNGKDPLTGLGGVLYAQYGVLVFLRGKDLQLSRSFSEGGVLFGIVVGLACLAGSTIGIVTGVDNLAHMVGLIYGLVWGFVLTASPILMKVTAALLLGCHLFLWPAFSRLIQPEENARYHWWLAETSEDPDFKKEHYANASELDPELERPWIAMAELELQAGKPKAAWSVILDGMSECPTLEVTQDLGRRIWDEFSTEEERKAAWELAESRAPVLEGLLSPRQMVVFRLETNEPAKAWTALMRELRGLPPPKTPLDVPPDIMEFTDNIWSQLRGDSARARAIQALDRVLDLNRRAWHLAVVPNRTLIDHYRNVGENLWAWEAVIRELKNDSQFQNQGQTIAKEIWQELPSELRKERARKILSDEFGVESLRWQFQLGILSEAERNRIRPDQSIEIPLTDLKTQPPAPIPPINPDDPESAATGKKL